MINSKLRHLKTVPVLTDGIIRCCEVPGPWAVRKQMLPVVFTTISPKHEHLHSLHLNPQSFFLVTALKN